MARHRESLEQQAFVQWCRLHPVARLIFAIPNGGSRRPVEAAILKAEGVLAGIPDLMLPVAKGGCNGLFVEMKSPIRGRESAEQYERMEELVAAGYACVVAYGAGYAIDATREYLQGSMGPDKYILKSAASATSG